MQTKEEVDVPPIRVLSSTALSAPFATTPPAVCEDLR
jgi:hypothetical protein